MRKRFFSKRAIPKHSKIIPKQMKLRLKKSLKCVEKNSSIEFKEYDEANKCKKSHSLKPSDIKKFQILGQVWKKIIVCFDPEKSRLYLLDQHAAHERIRYTYLKAYFLENSNFTSELKSIYFRFEINNFKPDKEFIKNSGKNDIVKIPKEKIFRKIFFSNKNFQDLEKTRISEHHNSEHYDEIRIEIIDDYLDRIEEILKKFKIQNFKISLDVNNPRIIISNYPIYFKKFSSLDLIKQEISKIETFEGIKFNEIPKSLDKIIKEKSCKSAVKFNDVLSKSQAEIIIEDLKKCDYPLHCIHGRKTVHGIFLKNLNFTKNMIKYYKSILKL